MYSLSYTLKSRDFHSICGNARQSCLQLLTEWQINFTFLFLLEVFVLTGLLWVLKLVLLRVRFHELVLKYQMGYFLNY